MQSIEPSAIYTRVNQMPCEFDGCKRRQVAKGLCAPHYKQRAAGIELKPVRVRINKGRICLLPECGRRHQGFGYCAGHLKQLHAGNGFGPIVVRRPRTEYRNAICDFPDCAERSMHKGLCRQHRSIRQGHELTRDQIHALFAGNPRCAICDQPNGRGKRLVIDHDHACCPTTAVTCGSCVRGLLCSPCNTGIGHLRESQSILRAALQYLENYHGTDK